MKNTLFSFFIVVMLVSVFSANCFAEESINILNVIKTNKIENPKYVFDNINIEGDLGAVHLQYVDYKRTNFYHTGVVRPVICVGLIKNKVLCTASTKFKDKYLGKMYLFIGGVSFSKPFFVKLKVSKETEITFFQAQLMHGMVEVVKGYVSDGKKGIQIRVKFKYQDNDINVIVFDNKEIKCEVTSKSGEVCSCEVLKEE